MHTKPLISVIITTHNRPTLLTRALTSLLSQKNNNFVTRALTSLLSQKNNNFEIILCADESSKETKEIAQRFLRSCDSFISAPNLRGPAETRNLGINLASGKWICFLDDDNTYPENYLNLASNLLTDDNEIHYFNYNEIFENRDSIDPKIISTNERDISSIPIEELLVCNFIPNNALFIANEIAKTHLFDVYLQSHEDWDWLINLKSKNYVFKHHRAKGPNRHIISGSSRNNDAHLSKSVKYDFLSIYRKWPAESERIKIKRTDQLKNLGLVVPADFL